MNLPGKSIGVLILPINSKIRHSCLCVLLALLACNVKAQDPVDRSIVTLGVGYGYYQFHDNRALDDRDMWGGNLGLQFTRSFSLALAYYTTIARQNGMSKREFENFFVQGNWFFNTGSSLRPYVFAGLGQTEQDQTRLSDDTSINSGVGIRWVIAPKWSINLDWRALYSLDEHLADQAVISTLQYRFGEEKL